MYDTNETKAFETPDQTQMIDDEINHFAIAHHPSAKSTTCTVELNNGHKVIGRSYNELPPKFDTKLGHVTAERRARTKILDLIKFRNLDAAHNAEQRKRRNIEILKQSPAAESDTLIKSAIAEASE